MSDRTFTAQELLAYNGSDPSKPIYLSLKGVVYDVTLGKDFYGPGGAYGIFAGHDCSRALALMCLEEEQLDRDLDGVTPNQLETLENWSSKFNSKYPVVGKLVN